MKGDVLYLAKVMRGYESLLQLYQTTPSIKRTYTVANGTNPDQSGRQQMA